MKKAIKFLFAAVALVGIMASCGDKDKGTTGALTLSVDKTMIMADEVDAAKLTVKYDGTDVTNQAVIKVNGEVWEGSNFTAYEQAEYNITAEYNGKTSNQVTVAAYVMILKANKTTLVADGNDQVTFTVMMDGADITAQTSICIADDPEGLCLVGNVFATDNPVYLGDNVFEAKHLSNTSIPYSNKVKITVVAE